MKCLVKMKKLDKKQRNLLTALLFAVVLLEISWAVNTLHQKAPTSAEVLPLQASLELSPSEGTFITGENFEVQIVLEAEDTTATDGVDVLVTFDPTLLEVLDVSSTDFYPQRLLNTIDNEKRTIRLALANTPDRNEIKGGGIIATITFKPLQAGEAEVSFGDAIVADRGGLNILSRTASGIYLIE